MKVVAKKDAKNMKKDQQFEKEILKLINKKQEGGYWDFKLKWHNNKADLLHDILCMANNLENRDAYIIFGVKDEDFKIEGVDDEDENRKNTNDIVIFLRDKHFVGGIIPMARVETIFIDDKKLDVLVIEKSYNTPFRLTKNFKDGDKSIVCSKNIYTRIQDTNTPKDKTADIDKEEKLWRNRFRIDASADDKLVYYLSNPDNWEQTIDGCKYYYKFDPIYTLELGAEKDDYRDFLSYAGGFPDRSNFVEYAHIYVAGNLMKKIPHIRYDGGRNNLVVPVVEGFVHRDRTSDFWFIMSYIINNSIEGIFNNFLIKKCPQDRAPEIQSNFIVKFISKLEKEKFEKFLYEKYKNNRPADKYISKKTKYKIKKEEVEELDSSDDWDILNRNFIHNQFLINELKEFRNECFDLDGISNGIP